ncbi:MraZ protein [Cyclonatronum proteinivorum]|uniref:Transcriptional regulator MraZ n=1 Tax=Cyclonatronum proteinivorum TaxID=1457365 RepID=A0A345UIN7_9BACT|nr:division/cell wall cluster transcriptional repressor MraZ [Cyclonatronum proteinivorum]AXJ00339.1 MraZ protein [Cyclonatronum proteinivorum]
MASFKGEYENAIDNKGRVCFPAKLRKVVTPEFQDQYVIVIATDPCLYVYPLDHWEEVRTKLSGLNSFNKTASLLKRKLLRNSVDVTLDKQNRVAFSPRQMAHAGLQDKAVFIGCDDRIEIWSPEYLEQADAEFTDEMFAASFEALLGSDPHLTNNHDD